MVTWMTANWIYFIAGLATYLVYRLGYLVGYSRGYQRGAWTGEKVGYNRRKYLDHAQRFGGGR